MTGARVLLTGGTGFLGSRVARALVEAGCAVTILARPDSSLARLEGIAARLDVCRPGPDAAAIAAFVAEIRPDAVVHVAAVSRSGEAPEDVARMVAANVTLPAVLLATGVRRFVNTGTSWQDCGPNGGEPFNVYAATKQACEAIIAARCTAGLRAITLRLFDIYGPEDGRGKVVELIAEAVATGRPLAMSPGEQVIDLSHVDDIARGYVLALRRLLTDEAPVHAVYGLSGERLTLRALATRIGAVAGRAAPIEWGGRPYRPREIMHPWTGYAPLPGWAPTIPLDTGLRQVLAG